MSSSLVWASWAPRGVGVGVGGRQVCSIHQLKWEAGLEAGPEETPPPSCDSVEAARRQGGVWHLAAGWKVRAAAGEA